jgi:hypothetical protein
MAIMNELIAAGLFGRGLIPVDNPVLVERYNACLEDMGLPRTSLDHFQFDKMGWSPEIAAEQDNDYYLSHGDANPLAIVLVPEQHSPRTPIYYPYHSYDWNLMLAWGTTNRTPIFDATKDTALWLDIDQEVDLYQTPADLRGVSEVIVRTYTPDGLIPKAIKQHELVSEFLRKEDSYRDTALIERLRQSRAAVGDLRGRSLIIRDYQYSDVRNFYSRAFGGVFMLRSRSEPLIFCRDPKVARRHGLFEANTKALETLVDHGYAETDVEWWGENLYRLRIIAESFLMEVLDEEEPECEFLSLNSAKQKSLIRKHASKLGTYIQFKRLIEELEQGTAQTIVPAEVLQYLVHPAKDLTAHSHEVIGQLLSYIYGGRLIPVFYRHQKSAFLRAYTKQWKKPRRQWALARIREHYDLASKSSDTPS